VHLRYQAYINISRCQRAGHGYEPAVPPHQLDDPDSALSGLRLDIGGVDELDGGLARRVDPERPIDEGDVVVDGLRDTTDRDLDVLGT
jgi:hypothetical protein